MKKTKNFLLKCTAVIDSCICAVCGCMLDSKNWVPFFVTIIIGCSWLILFSYVNFYRREN